MAAAKLPKVGDKFRLPYTLRYVTVTKAILAALKKRKPFRSADLKDELIAAAADSKPTVAVSGLYVRTRGGANKQAIDVLLEIDGEMRLVQSHFIGDVGGEISHHSTALGLSRKHTRPDPLSKG